MSDRYDNVWLVFYNENPAEEGDSFLGAFIRKFEMASYIAANFKAKDFSALKVYKMSTRHFTMGDSDTYWKQWHHNLDRFQHVDISFIFAEKKKE